MLEPSISGESVHDVEFDACDVRRCVDETIVDDTLNEPVETYSISLTRISPFITLSTTTGTIVINDDDGKPIKPRYSLLHNSYTRHSSIFKTYSYSNSL